MPVSVEFHFDFGSPNAYLSHLVVPGIEGRTGVRFAYVPVLLGGVFKVTGNVSPAVSLRGIKNKGEYAELETRRSLAQHGITNYTPNPFFPVNTLQIHAWCGRGVAPRLLRALRRRGVPAHVGRPQEDGRSASNRGGTEGIRSARR